MILRLLDRIGGSVHKWLGDIDLRRAAPTAVKEAAVYRNNDSTSNDEAVDDGRSMRSKADDRALDPKLAEARARSRRVRELVPAIGAGWHWYDVLYRFLSWCQRSWVRKLLPYPLRVRVTRMMNFLIPFHEIEERRARELDDPWYSLSIPHGESVTQFGVWVVEFFPPSEYSNLQRQLNSNGWDKDGFTYRTASNAEIIAEARTGKGFIWTRIGEVQNPDPAGSGFDAVFKPLPSEFSSVQIEAVQIGRSLTAIVGFFVFSEAGARELDAVWRAPQEPYLIPRGLKRAEVADRRIAGIRATKAERQRLHDEARKWLAKHCKGFFAASADGQPTVDLTQFSIYDPLAEGRHRDNEMHDCLRALGMSEVDRALHVSPQIPGGTFVPVESFESPLFGSFRNSWGFIGSRDRMQEHEDPAYGRQPRSAASIAHAVNDPMRAFLLKVAVQKYLQELQGTYARARDSARSTHRRYRASRLRNLRSEMLQTSLDLHVVARDVGTLWDGWHLGIQVTWQDKLGAQERRTPDIDFIDDLRERQESGFEVLTKEDAAYRELMVTVASLGSSEEASRLSRRALTVSAVSLVVAALTLVLADTGPDTLWASLVGLFGF